MSIIKFVTGLLSTKFFFPPTPAGFVKRPQLLEVLDQALIHHLTLVSAPAGAGKTVLVSAWVQSARKKGLAFGWLSLDATDNDPGRFLEYLGACRTYSLLVCRAPEPSNMIVILCHGT